MDKTVTVNGWTVTRTHLCGGWYSLKAQRTYSSKTGAFTQALSMPWRVAAAQPMLCFGGVGSTTVAYGSATYDGSQLKISFAGYGASATVIAAGNVLLAD